MRQAAVTLVTCLALAAGVSAVAQAASPTLPDPDYCSRRDADPRKCVTQDGPQLKKPAGSTPLPDPEYCSQRDADPRKCVIQDGPPPAPIVRKKPPQPPVKKPVTAPSIK